MLEKKTVMQSVTGTAPMCGTHTTVALRDHLWPQGSQKMIMMMMMMMIDPSLNERVRVRAPPPRAIRVRHLLQGIRLWTQHSCMPPVRTPVTLVPPGYWVGAPRERSAGPYGLHDRATVSKETPYGARHAILPREPGTCLRSAGIAE